jgi:iron uptake system EfeUOB component EfeO/EfeM
MRNVLVLPGMGAALATLALAGCAPPPATPADGVAETAVTVTDTVCVPNEITVKAGKNRFVISNRSMRPLEWEILDGVMVVDERENIVPGLVQRLTTTLKPGRYVMTCGLLTNPRGSLIVSENADAPKSGPTPLEFVSAQAEYKVFVHQRVTAMTGEVADFSAALSEGDIARARQLYPASRHAWQQLAPIAVLASAQYDRLEGAATLYRGGADDAEFVGWHKVGVDGLFKGSALIAGRIAERKLKGLDNPFAGTDLGDAADNLVGLRKIVSVFDRALGEHAPQQRLALQAGLETLERGLADSAAASALPAADREPLAASARQLAADFTATLEHLGM